jgi:hypothetical protein
MSPILFFCIPSECIQLIIFTLLSHEYHKNHVFRELKRLRETDKIDDEQNILTQFHFHIEAYKFHIELACIPPPPNYFYPPPFAFSSIKCTFAPISLQEAGKCAFFFGDAFGA